MLRARVSWGCGAVVVAMFCLAACVNVSAQTPSHYEPTVESLNQHPLPAWYADAKLGIFIHWGLYSVPGWAPLVHPNHDFTNADYMLNNPYAEWYLNRLRIEGSPTQAYHREHYGANYDYYNFALIFIVRFRSGIPMLGQKSFMTRAPGMSCSPPSTMKALPCGRAPHLIQHCPPTGSMLRGI